MFVKYEGFTPFGLVENLDKDDNYLGTSMQINCEGEYLRKARELDRFFINAFYENKWSLNKTYQRVLLKDMMNMVKVVYGKEFVKILIELIKILKRENI